MGYPARKSIRKAAARKRAVASSRLDSEDKLGEADPSILLLKTQNPAETNGGFGGVD
jgi:hypothetical protein